MNVHAKPRETVFAWTAPGSIHPEYVNLTREGADHLVITVRAPALPPHKLNVEGMPEPVMGAQAQMVLPIEQVFGLMTALLDLHAKHALEHPTLLMFGTADAQREFDLKWIQPAEGVGGPISPPEPRPGPADLDRRLLESGPVEFEGGEWLITGIWEEDAPSGAPRMVRKARLDRLEKGRSPDDIRHGPTFPGRVIDYADAVKLAIMAGFKGSDAGEPE